MNRNRISTSTLLLAGAALITVGVPLLLGAGNGDEALQARRGKIAAMTAAERDRLLAKHQEFLALSEADRRKYRDLHDALERDRSLRAVMDEYQDWLTTVTPWQREELRQESTVARRIEIVREIRTEQKEEKRRQEELDSREMAWLRAPTIPLMPRAPGRWRGLRRDDLNAMMRVVEESLSAPARQDSRLRSAEGARRHVLVLTAALREARAGQSGGSPGWPDEPLMERLLAAIGSERTKEFLQQAERPQTRTIALLSQGIASAWWWEARQRTISEEELKQLFHSLDSETREALAGLRPDERSRRLRRLRHHRDRESDWHELDEILNRIFPRTPPPFRPPPRPPES